MHFIKRAILMAAGRGERLMPLTGEIPKPLIPVHGTPMIESMIGALGRQGITEIHVVVGYMADRFAYLEDKYPGVRLIPNPLYDRCNNISSLYAAREYLEDVLIADADQLVRDDSALAPAFERSGYNAVRCTGPTREWLMQTDAEGIVTSCSRTGGTEGWQLYSISRWSAADGARLRARLEEAFADENRRNLYWDDVPMFLYPGDFRLGVREMDTAAVTEIDDLHELAAEDPSYRDLLAERYGIRI